MWVRPVGILSLVLVVGAVGSRRQFQKLGLVMVLVVEEVMIEMPNQAHQGSL